MEAQNKPKVYSGGIFENITYAEATKNADTYKGYIHAAHGMLYADDGDKLWEETFKPASIMMQVRFDGTIGFPGGLLDKGQGVESVVEGLNRELEEEIGLDLKRYSFCQSDHTFSHKNTERKLICHFYVKKVDKKDFHEIEKAVLGAPDWGVETMGLFRVPLYVMKDGNRGFPIFLTNKFAGNAKGQLLEAIECKEIIPKEKLNELMEAHEKYCAKNLRI